MTSFARVIPLSLNGNYIFICFSLFYPDMRATSQSPLSKPQFMREVKTP